MGSKTHDALGKRFFIPICLSSSGTDGGMGWVWPRSRVSSSTCSNPLLAGVDDGGYLTATMFLTGQLTKMAAFRCGHTQRRQRTQRGILRWFSLNPLVVADSLRTILRFVASAHQIQALQPPQNYQSLGSSKQKKYSRLTQKKYVLCLWRLVMESHFRHLPFYDTCHNFVADPVDKLQLKLMLCSHIHWNKKEMGYTNKNRQSRACVSTSADFP